MEIDNNVPQKGTVRRRRYDFKRVRPGDSAWVETSAERVRLLAAFKYWVLNNDRKDVQANAYAVSEKVGDDDPRGPGYRVFFKSRETVTVVGDKGVPSDEI